MKEVVTVFKYINVFLSLGSNAGERLRTLKSAISRLDAHPEISICVVSCFYETDPLYYRFQPDFLNCAVKLSTNLRPEVLLSECLRIEREMGRLRSNQKHQSRPIDIDIVFFGKKIIYNSELQVPHKQYAERRFVLVPINDIAPDFVCPDSGATVKYMFDNCPDHSRVEHYLKLELI